MATSCIRCRLPLALSRMGTGRTFRPHCCCSLSRLLLGSIKPIQQGGGWFFTINVSQGGSKSYISCNVSDAELRLIKTVMQASTAWRQRGDSVHCR